PAGPPGRPPPPPPPTPPPPGGGGAPRGGGGGAPSRPAHLTPPVSPRQLELREPHRHPRPHVDRAVRDLLDHRQLLHVGPAERDDHPPRRGELLDQLARGLGGGGGDQHRVERR